MKHLRTLVPAIAVALLASAVIAAGASAEGGGRKHRDGDTGTALPGVIEASGDGIAAAAGKLALRICAEDGLLITKGGVSIEEGAYEDTVGGWLGLNVYFGFAGCATIGPEETEMAGFGGNSGGGEKTAALAVGTGLTLEAVGTGIAFLSGEGTWSDALGGSGVWDGSVLKIGGSGSSCGDVEATHGGSGGYEKKKCEAPDDEDDEDDE